MCHVHGPLRSPCDGDHQSGSQMHRSLMYYIQLIFLCSPLFCYRHVVLGVMHAVIAGALPAQFLLGLLQQVGCARQEDLSHVPACLPCQICSQSAHQHPLGLCNSNGQAGSAPSQHPIRRGVPLTPPRNLRKVLFAWPDWHLHNLSCIAACPLSHVVALFGSTSMTRTVQTRHSPRTARCVRGAQTQPPAASWSPSQATILVPSLQRQTLAAR